METIGVGTLGVSIDDIAISTTPSSKAESSQGDERTLQEVGFLDEEARKAHIASYNQDVKHRAEYAPKIFWLIVGWILGIFVLLALQGFHPYSFNLSDSVLIAVISGTTLNVLGIFVIVANYIFRKQ